MKTAQRARMFERFLERKMRADRFSIEYEVCQQVMLALAYGHGARMINQQIHCYRKTVWNYQNRATKNLASVGQGSRRTWA